MWAALIKILEWFAKGGVSSFLIGSGLTVVAFSGVDILVTAAFDTLVGYLNGLPADAFKLVMLTGLGEALSIVASAILTRLALEQAMSALSIGRAST